MKNKGFTLIELIGSIVILSVIALVAFPAILGLLTSSQEKIDESKKQFVQRAAKEYVEDNINNYPRKTTEPSKNIKVKDLIEQGYIKEKTIDQVKDSTIYNGCVKVSVSQKNVEDEEMISYDFEFISEC